jgi:hypothetical protein
MATFSPSSYGYIYKKFATAPPPVLFNINSDVDTLSNLSNVRAKNLPAWLELYNSYYNSELETYTFYVRLKPLYVQTMPAGFYSVSLDMWGNYAKFPYFGMDIDLNTNIFVTLEVKDTLLLAITPTSKVFEYIIGGTVPQNETLQVTSESNWNVAASQSWVTLSSSVGVGAGQIYFGVNPAGLTVGQYEAIVTVTDNLFVKTLTVILIISEGDTLSTYLYIEPRNIQYVSELGIANTTQKALNLENSHAWTAVASQPWIVLSAASGDAGISTINVSVNSALLPVNNYVGEIIFTSNGIIKKVFVLLSVVEFLTSGLLSETLYFADDHNKLKVTNVENNTFLSVDASASHATGNLNYQFEAPYFKGIASVVIGKETNNLLKSVIPTNNLATRVQNNIAPINIGLTVFNKNRFTEATAQVAQYANLYFLTGKTPVILNKLCNIPQTIYVTKKAVLSLSLLANTPPSQIVITGAVSAIIGTSIASNLYVYNAIVNLKDFTLATGDAITITYGSLVVNVVIKKEVPETRLLAFENEWKEYEFFETTGFLIENKNADKTDTEIQIEGEKHTKTVSIDIGKDYTLNTGFIYSQDEVIWLSKILEAKRIFLYEGTNPVEIILETKSMQIYKTRDTGKSFALKFKKAIV